MCRVPFAVEEKILYMKCISKAASYYLHVALLGNFSNGIAVHSKFRLYIFSELMKREMITGPIYLRLG